MCPRILSGRHDAIRPPGHRPGDRLDRSAAGYLRRGRRRAIPPQRRLAPDPGRLGSPGVPRHLESQPAVLCRRRRAGRRRVRSVARRTRPREHRAARRGRSTDRHGHPAPAAVQRAPLFPRPVEEHRLLGPLDVCGLLPAAVGMDPRRRRVRGRGVALRGTARVKLAAFFLLALFVHGPLSPLLPTAFEATLLYYARFYPGWVLALVGTAAASLAEAVNYRLVDWAAELPKLSALKARKAVRWSIDAFSRAPFWTTAIVIFSPIPDSAVRILAPLSRYPLPKFLAAVAFGRFPRLLLIAGRSEEHTSELQSPCNLVCRLLLEKKKEKRILFYVQITVT